MRRVTRSTTTQMKFMFGRRKGRVPLKCVNSIGSFRIIKFPRIGSIMRAGVAIVRGIFGVALVRTTYCISGGGVTSYGVGVFLSCGRT